MARADCPHCGGTGWKTVETAAGRLAVPCDCTADGRASLLFRRARIPARYDHCDFSNFETDIPHDSPEGLQWNQSLEQAKLVAESFARNFPLATEHGLLLSGPSGAGKTHLAVAALKEILLRGHDGLFYDYRELLKEIQSSYNAESQTTEMEILEPVVTADLLLLDDLGASKPSAWALETVGYILNRRYNEKRITLITTNYLDGDSASAAPPRLPSGAAIARAEESLADRVGHRIRSRLYEMCRTVVLLAPDYRKEFRGADRFRA